MPSWSRNWYAGVISNVLQVSEGVSQIPNSSGNLTRENGIRLHVSCLAFQVVESRSWDSYRLASASASIP
jgi:hypothetical protein